MKEVGGFNYMIFQFSENSRSEGSNELLLHCTPAGCQIKHTPQIWEPEIFLEETN